MNLRTILEQILGGQRCATDDDIREVFGDYHNLLRWLAAFLIEDEELAEACIIDACTIAESQTPDFHEWLVHWAARATVRWALQGERDRISELAHAYEQQEPVHLTHPPLSPEYFVSLIRHSDDIHARLDVLCRLVLVLRGIAKDSCEELATQLGIGCSAIEQAYCVAYHAIERSSDRTVRGANESGWQANNEHTLADSIA